MHTARSPRTRPRSCTGVNPRRCSAQDSPAVRPVLSTSSRRTADPVCHSPVAVDFHGQVLRPRALSCTLKVLLDLGPMRLQHRILPAQEHFSLLRHTYLKITMKGEGGVCEDDLHDARGPDWAQVR